ncbi:RNA polymerase sigma factor sigD, chloroplastic-like, partial [Neltuma alba]|uniref:RNA polymerase sigma factor sigD, chloroplastic-like n=1 Tax=Neltuma alba TaxID=207710 RepID=UPI0010A57AEE
MAIASICSSPSPAQLSPPFLCLHFFHPRLTILCNPLYQLLVFLQNWREFGSGDSLPIAEAAEAIALAGAAGMEAANGAVSVASGTGKVGHPGEDDNEGVSDGSVGIEVRRKRRRKRRKGLGSLDGEEYKRNFPEQRILVDSVKSWCLSSKEEAELCLCLKEGTRIENAMLRTTESEENLSISRKKPLGLRERNLDKVLCNTRESRERIAPRYQGL